MKRQAFSILIGISLLTSGSLPMNDVQGKEARQVGEYQIVGNVKDPALKELMTRSSQKRSGFLRVKKSQKTKAVLIDGKQVTVEQLKGDEAIQEAIVNATPIVISHPKKGELGAITGADLDNGKTAIIFPGSKGREFEIRVVSAKPGVQPKGGFKGSSYASSSSESELIEQFIEQREEWDDEPTTPGKHMKWIVREDRVWGNQGQYIDMGFEYTLGYDNTFTPAKKVLKVQTVGLGTSPGMLGYDFRGHRGFFQKEVEVKIHAPSFSLKDYTPETSNDSNSASKEKTKGMEAGGFGMEPELIFSVSKSKGFSTNYNDFSVKVDRDPTNRALQWIYWMSSSDNGKEVRRDSTPTDLRNCSFVTNCRLYPLPPLAKSSVLMPHAEAVYYTKGSDIRMVNIEGSVTQTLMDIYTPLLLKTPMRVQTISEEVRFPLRIDLSRVVPSEKE